MRSFQLILVIISLLFVQSAQSSDSEFLPEAFFTITLPYDNVGINSSEPSVKKPVKVLDSKVLLAKQAQKAMQILLLRLNGREQLMASSVGQDYIKNAQNWLSSYNIKPRVEDGVNVGQNIELHFDQARLKKSFKKHHIKLWAANQRPQTLVMGTLVQQGRLVKLDQEILDYRVDVDYRNYPKQLKLPITVAENPNKWVFPIESAPLDTRVQEVLIASNHKNLLSFKLLALENKQYELTWFLFAINGSTLAHNETKGKNRQALMHDMFKAVMQQYVKLSAVKNVRKNHVYLNVHGVTYGQQVNQLEAELKKQQPMIRNAQLTSLQTDNVQFDIEYQGDYQVLLNWIKNWSKVGFGQALSNQEIDVFVRPEHFQPQ
ncbi:DUF2066 domain-containing protein [Thiomicrorhabdus sp. Milos-T2]|uniref:DUF2066 domain-containing protein n=1 Tax=Thiomicrorhabdus sp. Milos-T2 TaxID=90814 RepID=UPI000494882B|nr:DUF2066 domain-containing protein [Thiomicrorhabdus sp. Milos-T2]